jgi:hypothetical protein
MALAFRAVNPSSKLATSLLRKRAAEALRQARKLPVGPDRNELRQLAMGLIWLDKTGLAAKLLDRTQAHVPTMWDPARRKRHAPTRELTALSAQMGSPSDPI